MTKGKQTGTLDPRESSAIHAESILVPSIERIFLTSDSLQPANLAAFDGGNPSARKRLTSDR